MKAYCIDLRSCRESERERVKGLLKTLAWETFDIAGIPNVCVFMWDHKEPVEDVLGVPGDLISTYVFSQKT